MENILGFGARNFSFLRLKAKGERKGYRIFRASLAAAQYGDKKEPDPEKIPYGQREIGCLPYIIQYFMSLE